MKKSYSVNELKQLIAVCVSTFYNLNGFLPDAQELCRQIGSEYARSIHCLL